MDIIGSACSSGRTTSDIVVPCSQSSSFRSMTTTVTMKITWKPRNNTKQMLSHVFAMCCQSSLNDPEAIWHCALDWDLCSECHPSITSWLCRSQTLSTLVSFCSLATAIKQSGTGRTPWAWYTFMTMICIITENAQTTISVMIYKTAIWKWHKISSFKVQHLNLHYNMSVLTLAEMMSIFP